MNTVKNKPRPIHNIILGALIEFLKKYVKKVTIMTYNPRTFGFPRIPYILILFVIESSIVRQTSGSSNWRRDSFSIRPWIQMTMVHQNRIFRNDLRSSFEIERRFTM